MKKMLFMLSIAAFMLSGCNEANNEKVKAESNDKATEVKKPEAVTYNLAEGERAITTYVSGQPKLVMKFEGKDDNEKAVYQKEYFENGQVSKEGPLKDGKCSGVWKSYYKTGELWGEGNYVNGKYDGLVKAFYQNGKVRYEGEYKNGLKSGAWKFFNEEGMLTETKNY